MEKRLWNKGNCMRGCKHACYRDLYEHVKDDDGNIIGKIHRGYEHYCNIDSPNYKAWHERNRDKLYNEYTKDTLECYEPNELQENLNKIIELADDILENTKEK